MSINKTAIISMVGRPNVGKSTLTNQLVGHKVAIVSDKPQTTRTRITGVLPKGDCQFVFMDTPGLHKPRSRLGDFMVKVVGETVSEVDACVLLVEPTAHIGAPEQALIDQFKAANVPAVLAINKVDTIRKDQLLAVMALYGAAFDFAAVVPISAKTGENTALLLEELEKFALEGPALFPEDMISDQPLRQQVAEIIREKLLAVLDREVPHGVAVGIERMESRENGLIDIHAVIFCEKSSHKGIIIGKKGEMLRRVGEMSRKELEIELEEKVYLELWVKVKEGWRDNQYQMRNFGYVGE